MTGQHLRRAFWVVAIVAIACGVLVRLLWIDRKVYGVDETVTSMRAAGETYASLDAALESRQLPSLRAVRERFQSQHAGRGAGATVQSLVVEDPQHPPFYFVVRRAWQEVFGPSITARRALAVGFGLLLLPACWWLGVELRAGPYLAPAATALVAVSPFHALYAQYDREYGLWALLSIVSTALLVRALRVRVPVTWLGYALVNALALYTDPLFGLVLVAHAIFVLVAARSRDAIVPAAAALVCAFALFLPWIAVMIARRNVIGTTTQWFHVALPARLFISKHVFNFASVFFDAEYVRIALAPVAALVAIGAAAAVVALRWRRARTAALLLFCIAACASLPLVAADLVLHESRSTASRYLTPAWLALEFIVALWAAESLAAGKFRWPALGGFALLCACGIFSLAISAPRSAWWIDSNDAPLVPIAARIAALPDARFCYFGPSDYLLMLADRIERDVPIVYERRGSGPATPCLAVGEKREVQRGFRGTRVRMVLLAEETTSDERTVMQTRAALAKARGAGREPVTIYRVAPLQAMRRGVHDVVRAR